MEHNPTIAFVTTCKGRTQHLAETLPQNMSDNRYANTKFIVVDYASQDNLAEFVACKHHTEIASGRLTYYHYRNNHSFRMAHAKNMAHRLGIREGADIIVNLDADNFTGPDFDEFVLGCFRSITDAEIFLWPRMIKGVLPKGISGRIVVSKDTFLASGGYDEKYDTYSPDDKDFKARLLRMGYTAVEIDPMFLNAIRHNDKMRFKEYPEAADISEETFTIDQKNRVRNYGNIGCGVVWRNFGIKPIEIKPIPTRVFGIGLHKTATSSFHHAMQILGYRSGHWKDAHWAKKCWKEITTEGTSMTMERCYALSDLPFPLLYRELDAGYPNSKFVLTIRDEADWIESVRRHWLPEYNRFRHQWKNDPFTTKAHKLLYGQKGFDAELFLARYRKHNAEVLAYFANRQLDLLVMDMSDNAGWDELCSFLDVPRPWVPYPSSNVSPT